MNPLFFFLGEVRMNPLSSFGDAGSFLRAVDFLFLGLGVTALGGEASLGASFATSCSVSFAASLAGA